MEVTLLRPDDWHLHLRDGPALASVVGHSAERFARAIIMPNLKPPIVSTEAALAYRQRILEVLPEGSCFQPLLALYLTDNTLSKEVQKAKQSGYVKAVKYYPAGATTHSDRGVTDVRKVFGVLGALEEVGMPLLVHGEVTDPAVDIFDRERVFIERVLAPLLERFQGLKIVFEHVTTQEAVEFVTDGPERLAATITAHHLLLNRNALFEGGLRPHHYCLPVLKREQHRQALIKAATSGNPKFFLGTDSAPHHIEGKEADYGCAGIYTSHAAIELYAEVFEEAGALGNLEGFASHFGADFYGLPRNEQTLSLRRKTWQVPGSYEFGSGRLVPLRAGGQCLWHLEKS